AGLPHSFLTNVQNFQAEAALWVTVVLMSGFFDRHPKINAAVFEASSTWLSFLIDECDKNYRLYRNERQLPPLRKLPSETFFEHCVTGFEGDEAPPARLPEFYGDILCWSSDVYHHDGDDAWRAIETMQKHGLPKEDQAKFLGANERREGQMTTKDFVVFDSDSHVVEPPVVWEEFLDPEYRTLGKHALWRQEGRTGAYLKVNGEIFRDRSNPNLPRHALWRPGMTWEAIGELDPHTKHPATEGASDPRRRVSDMDAMGVDQALLYPTWFAEGFFLVRDPDVAYALARAYNDWVTDFCKAAPERLFAAAVLP